MAEHLFINEAGSVKKGNDTIFAWWAKYQDALKSGRDAVNGTIGALLENDGTLAINKTVDATIREAPENDIASYAPLSGLPDFLDLSKSLALGDTRDKFEKLGFNFGATASPGGSGALYLAANNFLESGENVLLRNRHWKPYGGFLANNGLGSVTWPLLPDGENSELEFFAQKEFSESLEQLCQKQSKVMVWLNDPAHNPTGLSMTENDRFECLNTFVDSAINNEKIGHTLLIDSAYSLYAEEPFGWAETILESVESGLMWPENLLICFAISLSKSHTIYGLRTGALVSMHPDAESISRINSIMGVTARQTWSATSRLGQYSVVKVHNSEKLGEEWSNERDRLARLLKSRRDTFVSECKNLGIPINPTMDGFFAWLEHDNPEEIAQKCAQQDVYLVPLEGGVRIGLCAIPEDKITRVAEALSVALS